MEAHICARSGGLPGAKEARNMDILGKAKPVSRAEMKLNEQEQEFAHNVATSNQRFEKASPARKRVAIAKDVLKWLKAGKIVAEPGTYIGLPLSDDYGHKDVSSDKRVNGDSCRACALGAVFACAVERAGGINNFWGRSSYEMRLALEPFFSLWQLQLIETAFEQSHGFAIIPNEITTDDERYDVFDKERDRAVDFGKKHGVKNDATDRMKAIMQNIIANKGTFVP